MKKIKRTTSVLLAMIMLISMITGVGSAAFAEENATDVSETINQMLEVLPKTMDLDITEIEFAENPYSYSAVIQNKVEKVLKDSGFNLNAVKISIGLNTLNGIGEDCWNSVRVLITDTNSINGDSKCINLSFSNSNQFNEADRKYITSLDIKDKTYFELPIGYYKNGDKSYASEAAEKYFKSIIGDDTVDFVVQFSMIDNKHLSNEAFGAYIGIFRNGILYDIRELSDKEFVAVIPVPENVTEDKLADYISGVIKTNFSDEYINDAELTSVEKGFVYAGGATVDYKNGYTLNFDGYSSQHIVVNTEKTVVDNNGTDISENQTGKGETTVKSPATGNEISLVYLFTVLSFLYSLVLVYVKKKKAI